MPQIKLRKRIGGKYMKKTLFSRDLVYINSPRVLTNSCTNLTLVEIFIHEINSIQVLRHSS
jgi:hypothetical protein